MDTSEFVRHQFASLHQRIDAVMQDTTQDHFNWIPPGTANSIGATFLHLLNAEDLHIQSILQDRPRIWESGRWSQVVGLPAPPGRGLHWEEARNAPIDITSVRRYQDAVRAATHVYLVELTDEKLGNLVGSSVDAQSVAQVLSALVIHITGHAGEIAALKGVQGARGLPF